MITPLPGYVTIEPIEETTTENGLYVPNQQETLTGKVLAIGESTKIDGELVYSPVGIGQTVVYRRYTDQEIKDKGQTIKLVKFADLMGKVTN